MSLTKTQQQVLEKVLWYYATDAEKELIKVELFDSIVTPENQEDTQLSFNFDEVEEEKPPVELIPNVELARRAMQYAINKGITLDMLAVMCNAHINWPGTKRHTKAKSMNQLMNTGYNFSHGKWSPYLTEKRCIVIADFINKMFPAWGKEEGITQESILNDLLNAPTEDDSEDGDSL